MINNPCDRIVGNLSVEHEIIVDRFDVDLFDFRIVYLRRRQDKARQQRYRMTLQHRSSSST
jgi:hypothetical protein